MRKEDEYDLGLRSNIDNTTSVDYTYICKALDPNADVASKVWVCYRIVNATGSKAFANGVDTFGRKEKLITVADALTATYAS